MMQLPSDHSEWAGFQPAVAHWFKQALGAPTQVQWQAWPLIAAGENVLIAAPTGSGKTLAAFLAVIDRLSAQAACGALEEVTHVLYVSPLKALSNDIQRNLQGPLKGIADLQLGQPITAMVRTGDTTQRDRDRMRRQPPHILVTTPESLYILLGSESGRTMLQSVGSVIIDEIHALIGSKRGAHLSLSLTRLQALADRPLQRIGLSATQRPVEDVAHFLCAEQPCHIIDAGHHRNRDLGLEVPGSGLSAIMSNEVWAEVYDRIAQLSKAHRTTLVFVNTRRLAERVSRHIGERLGEEAVAAHHGSMAKEHRLDAEQRLKGGELAVLVATASMELGIDVGEVDLVCQIGSPGGINSFLQRVGRSGHAIGATPKGRIFPTTLDEAVECTALLAAVKDARLDALEPTYPALDVLAQQIVGEVACREWRQDDLLALIRKSWPYRDLDEARFSAVLRMLSEGYTARRGRRGAYLHWDQVNRVVRGRRNARIVALTNAGVIPDQFDYDVILMPEGFKVGTLNEDFAFETLAGDIFQLGNQSYRVLRSETGRLFVEDARGLPPTVPFWLGEAAGRSDELSRSVSEFRLKVGQWLELGLETAVDGLVREYSLPALAARQLAEYLAAGQLALGVMPSQQTVVFERFFDDTGDMHLVIHSCFGSRINKAWGLALRKRFCRKFNFELQAAAVEDAIILSLGITHSFPLDEVARYLQPDNVRDVLEQALLDAPMFPTHWRWNASIALAVRRHLGQRKSPPAWQRNDAEDLMAVVFPDQIACLENISGKREIPDHPLVEQTLRDCLFDLMDLDGLQTLLTGLHAGQIQLVCAELTGPSVLAQEIINARPYAFLDDGDAENRRTMAIGQVSVTGLDDARAQRQLEPEAIAEVREQAMPQPRDAEELHDALVIHGYFPADELAAYRSFFEELTRQSRACAVRLGDGRTVWCAAERWADVSSLSSLIDAKPTLKPIASAAPHPLLELIRGRLEAVGPVGAHRLTEELQVARAEVDQALLALENEGFVVRGSFENLGEQWCERRLLARIHRYSRQRKRERVKPVSPEYFQRFLLQWHGLIGERGEGEPALRAALDVLAGYSAPAGLWESELLGTRLRGYAPEQLDRLCATGEVCWARLMRRKQASGRGPVRHTPVSLMPREDLSLWRALAPQPDDVSSMSSTAQLVLDQLSAKGALFLADLQATTGLLPSQMEDALGELVALGLIHADQYAGLRHLLRPASKLANRSRGRRRRGARPVSAGRWACLPPPAALSDDELAEQFLWTVLRRYGVVSRRILDKEAFMPPWRQLLRVAWTLEARGEIQGGRFIDGMAGEQFALPEAARALRDKSIAGGDPECVRLSATDPAHLSGVVLAGPKIPAGLHQKVVYRGGRLCAWLDKGEPQLAEGLGPGEAAEVLQCLTASPRKPYTARPAGQNLRSLH